MSDIFISYANPDRYKAHLFAQVFEAEGLSVFWDREIRSGTTWRQVIEVELEEARCVVVLWSEASAKSRWVVDEAQEALDRDILVPVLIEDVKVPMGFRSVHVAKLWGWDGTRGTHDLQRLIEDVSMFVEGVRAQPEDQSEQNNDKEDDRNKSNPIYEEPGPFSESINEEYFLADSPYIYILLILMGAVGGASFVIFCNEVFFVGGKMEGFLLFSLFLCAIIGSIVSLATDFVFNKKERSMVSRLVLSIICGFLLVPIIITGLAFLLIAWSVYDEISKGRSSGFRQKRWWDGER